MQLLYIGMVWWTSIKARPKEAGLPRLEERVAEHERPSRQGASS
jgi:sugar phosphate permease